MIHNSAFPPPAQVEEPKSIRYKLLLDPRIQPRFSLEGGGLIHLDEPRLRISIKHHIEAQDLETQLVLNVIRLAGAN